MKIKNFYNHTNLIHSAAEIDQINDYYKQHFGDTEDFETFITPIASLVDKNPLIRMELHKQFIRQKGLQGGILTEINIFTTVANLLDISYLTSHDNQYFGENDNWSIMLQGNLAHGSQNGDHDLVIVDKINQKTYSGEIKEPLARATDGDVRYDEEGRIYKTARQQIDLDAIKGFIEYYNNNVTIFSHMGHNYKLNPTDCEALFLNYFKDIDYIFTYVKDMLIVIPNNSAILSKVYSLKGSEIRGTGGKNPVAVFTPKYLEKTLQPFIITETTDNYTLVLGTANDEIHAVTGRGRADVTRYTIPYGFMFRAADVIEKTADSVTIPKNKIKQLNANLSVHIQLSSDYERIKNIVLGEK